MSGQARAIAVVTGSVAFLCGAGIATISGAPCDVAALRGLVIGGVAAVVARGIVRLVATLTADAVAAKMQERPETRD